MPDIYCPVCGEPWDHDELHDTGIPYAEASKRFRRVGCQVFDTKHGEVDVNRAEAAAVAYDLLGDDLDTASVELTDLFDQT